MNHLRGESDHGAGVPLHTGHFDGASNGNSGPSAIGFHIEDASSRTVSQNACRVEDGTNNEAEYRALLHLARRLVELGITDVLVCGDSQLVVNQVSGEWTCNHDRLRELRDACRSELAKIPKCKLTWVPRTENQRADSMAAKILGTGKEKGQMADMIPLGGLWKKESKNGKTYYAGKLGNARLLIFKNERKESDRHPDLTMFVAPAGDGAQGQRQGASNDRQQGGEDIPF